MVSWRGALGAWGQPFARRSSPFALQWDLRRLWPEHQATKGKASCVRVVSKQRGVEQSGFEVMSQENTYEEIIARFPGGFACHMLDFSGLALSRRLHCPLHISHDSSLEPLPDVVEAWASSFHFPHPQCVLRRGDESIALTPPSGEVGIIQFPNARRKYTFSLG